MQFILKTMDGNRFKITEEEYQGVIAGDGLLVFRSCGISINKSRIESVYPENVAQSIEKQVDRTKQMEGVTPEGEAVIKRFGQWFYKNVNEYQRDDERRSILEYTGNPLLPTPFEYEQEFSAIKPTEWREKLVGSSSEVDDRLLIDRDGRTSTQGLTKI